MDLSKLIGKTAEQPQAGYTLTKAFDISQTRGPQPAPEVQHEQEELLAALIERSPSLPSLRKLRQKRPRLARAAESFPFVGLAFCQAAYGQAMPARRTACGFIKMKRRLTAPFSNFFPDAG